MKSKIRIGLGVLLFATFVAITWAVSNNGLQAQPLDQPLSTDFTVYVGEVAEPKLSIPVSEMPIGVTTAKLNREINPIKNPGLFSEDMGRAGTNTNIQDALVSKSTNEGRTPTPIMTFEGQGEFGAVTPPDTNGDVGPNHYVQMVNLSYTIYDKAGNTLVGPLNNNTLWAGQGGRCETDNSGDPVVLYDEMADRWLLTQFAVGGSPEAMCLAVSQTPDPTGAYYLYEFAMPDFPDYPKLGIWPDGYYMGTNTGFPNQYYAHVFDRVNILAGNAAGHQYVDSMSNFLMPADSDSVMPPPTGTPGIFYTFYKDGYANHPAGVDRMEFYEFDVDWVTPANTTFTTASVLPITAFNYTVCGFFAGDCIPQPGTTQRLSSLSYWPMARLQYRNFGSYAAMVSNFTVDTDGSDHAGIRWFEVRKTGASPWSLYQEGTWAPDGEHRFMGSIAMDGSGNIALGYTLTGTSTRPSLVYATRLSTDPLGTLQAEATLYPGGGSQMSGADRWGDYSAMNVDPNDNCTFWFTSEYHNVDDTAFNWNTRIGTFKIPNCTGALGPTGTLTGLIDDGTIGIAGAVASATNISGTITSMADASGHYTMTLPVGNYDASAAAYGYVTSGLSPVAIISGTTTTQNFSLTAMGVLSGYVSDFDNDSPLEAVVIADDGTTTNSDPATGYYEMYMDAGTYVVTATVPNYVDGIESATITLGAATQQDFELLSNVVFTPSPVHVTLDSGTIDTAVVTLTNRMAAGYDFEFFEMPGGFAPAAIMAAGGPDAFGYTFRDSDEAGGPAFDWIEISGTGLDLTLADDAYEWPVNLPFTFNFYGTDMTQIAAQSNGTLSFQDDYLGYSNVAIPGSNSYGVDTFIAGYWDDLNPSAGGAVYYETVNYNGVDLGVVEWYQVPNYGTSDPVTYEVIFFPNGSILIQYLDPSSEAGSGATVGIQGDTATGLQYSFDTASLAANLAVCFEYPGSAGCAAGVNVPWFGQNIISGTVPATSDLNVTLTFSATTAAGVDQPGDYYASLLVNGNPSMEVPITMTVNSPSTWGAVGGTLTLLGSCDINPTTLADHEIYIEASNGMTETLMTDASGYYAYWIDESETVTVTVAPVPEYTSGFAANVAVVAGQTTVQDFDLRWLKPCTSVTPNTLEVTLLQTYSTTLNFDISNTGAASTTFTLSEKPGGFSPTHQPVSSYPQMSTPYWDETETAPKGFLDDVKIWGTGTSMPTPARYRAGGTTCDGKSFYVMGGQDDTGGFLNEAWRYDANSDTWTQLANIPVSLMSYEAACIDEFIYLVGGYDGSAHSNSFQIYDISADSWASSTWAKVGTPMTAVYDGLLYAFGGNPGPSAETWVYDPSAGTWTQLANMPTANAYGAAITVEDYIYQIGGGLTNTVQRYDPVSNTWDNSGPQLQDARMSALTSWYGDYIYVISGGGSAGNYWDAWATTEIYDLTQWPSGSWAYDDENVATPLVASAGGCVADAVWGATGTNGGSYYTTNQYLDDGLDCNIVAGDIPWLSEVPITGTVSAGGSYSIAVTFDTMTYTLGTYTGMLRVKSDDPVNSMISVPVTMHVVDAIAYGVDIAPSTAVMTGTVGATVTYTLRVTNTGNIADTFDLTLSGNSWVTALSDTSVMLNPGASVDVTVQVTVNAAAADGDSDAVMVTATSQGDGSKTAVSTLTTTATVTGPTTRYIYLPIIVK